MVGENFVLISVVPLSLTFLLNEDLAMVHAHFLATACPEHGTHWPNSAVTLLVSLIWAIFNFTSLPSDGRPLYFGLKKLL